jgi:hypothetical protein
VTSCADKLSLRDIILLLQLVTRTMRGLRQLLSDSMAVFLRLSACNTTSCHIPTVNEELSHLDHLPDQRSPAGNDEALPAVMMSPPPYLCTPSSYLQSLFDLTLREYSKETGIDLIRHSFAASLDNIGDVNTTIVALRERSQVSSDAGADDPIAELVSQLRSIAHIVSLLSPTEALRGNIDLVCLREHNSHILHTSLLTHFVAVLT